LNSKPLPEITSSLVEIFLIVQISSYKRVARIMNINCSSYYLFYSM